jgi:hypothetical protein
MSERITRLRMRGGTAAEWTAANPVLISREFGIETDTRRMKMGDGTTAWASLSYFLGGFDIRGQISRMTSQMCPAAAQGVYRSTGATGTLDTAASSGLVLGTTDTMGLRNTSGRAVLLRFYGSIDATAGNNQTLGTKLALNGTAIDATECRAFTGSGNQEAKLLTSWMINVPVSGEVSLLIANHSSSADVTLQRARLVASQVQV